MLTKTTHESNLNRGIPRLQEVHPFRASFITRVNAEKKIDLSAPHGTLRVPLDAPKSTALSKASTNKFNFKTGYSRASSLGNRLLSTPMSRGAHFFFSTFCVRTKSRLLMTIFLIPRRFIPIYFFWVL